MAQLNVQIDEELLRRFKVVAVEKGRTASTILRELIAHYVEQAALTEREDGRQVEKGSGSASARLPATLASDAHSLTAKSSTPASRSVSADAHFRPDPKPGRK